MKRQSHPEALQDAARAQLAALDPRRSVWISANAGTGKTEVLTYRILALLTADPTLEPAHILALTFTTAAAAEMAARLRDLLTSWNQKPDAELQPKLRESLGLNGTNEELARFRQLPALVADAPPTLTTIHGFAQQVLARLPARHGLPPRFEVIPDVTADGLLATALSRATAQATPEVALALATLLERYGDQTWRDLSALAEYDWPRLQVAVHAAGGPVLYLAELRAELGVPENFDPAAAEAAQTLTAAELTAIRVFAPEVEEAAAIVNAAYAEARQTCWLAWLLRKDGLPRQKLLNKKPAGTHPAEAAILQGARDRALAAREALKNYRAWELTAAWLVWGAAVQAELDALKARRQVRTFQDLLDGLEGELHTAVHDPAQAQWLWQRFERGARHLLVDEAQDNNPQQARLINLLIRTFLAGESADGPKTVLAVGDPKQSIYRFQGARPQLFADLRAMLDTWAPGSFDALNLGHSFRSPPAILAAVEKIFAAEHARRDLAGDLAWAEHQTVYPDTWGRAEVWPLLAVPARPEPPPFPVEPPLRSLEDGANLFGRRLAAWLHAQMAARPVMPSTGRPLAWGDVLVIVQRNETAAALAGALNAAGIPALAQGAKGGHAPAPLIGDLIALARVLHTPGDNLGLAQVLKSPLVGWSDDQLLHLAATAGEGLWLDHLATLDVATAAWLAHWQARARAVPPALWLAELTADPQVLGRYIRQGPLPDSALRAALAGALRAAVAYPHIPALLAAWEDEPPAPAPIQGNAVTVMTVHKAKGLGYPLVVVAETTDQPKNRNKLAWRETSPGHPDLVLLRQEKTLAPALQQTLDEHELNHLTADRRRGLYVALTRAKDWLVVAGWQGPKTKLDDTWYAWARAGLDADWRDDQGTRVLESGTPPATPDLAPAQPVAAASPVWLAPPPPPAPPAWPTEDFYDPAREAALERGTLQHRLLHALADIDPAQRPQAAGALLARWGAEAALAAPVLAVFVQHPQLFAAGSRGEVPVAVNGGEGRIDRLAPQADSLWLVDFKTETEPPATIPPAYRTQLQGYTAALQGVFPQPLRPGILWLATNTLAWLD
jgi:ATP-dependent helicase/nuclease subunit A